jgi:hypothetical protein
MDPTLHEVCNADQFMKCVHIGLLCVQDDPNDRPAMSNVITMLDSDTEALPTPKLAKQPAYVSSTASWLPTDTCMELTNSLEGG